MEHRNRFESLGLTVRRCASAMVSQEWGFRAEWSPRAFGIAPENKTVSAVVRTYVWRLGLGVQARKRARQHACGKASPKGRHTFRATTARSGAKGSDR